MSNEKKLATEAPVFKSGPEVMAEVFSVESMLNVQRDLGSLNSKLESVEKDLNNNLVRINDELREMNTGVTSINKKMQFGTGMAALSLLALAWIVGRYWEPIIEFLAMAATQQ